MFLGESEKSWLCFLFGLYKKVKENNVKIFKKLYLSVLTRTLFFPSQIE